MIHETFRQNQRHLLQSGLSLYVKVPLALSTKCERLCDSWLATLDFCFWCSDSESSNSIPRNVCVSAVVTDEVPLVMCSERWNNSLGARDSWKRAVVSSGVRCCRFVFLCLLMHFCSFLPCCLNHSSFLLSLSLPPPLYRSL